MPFSQLGLPLSLLNGTNVQASDLFEYRRVVNGDGGEINGVEVNYQHQLRFLPGFTVDASASYKLTDAVTLTLEALNLTDEFQDFYIDADDRVVLYHNTGRQYYFGARLRF